MKRFVGFAGRVTVAHVVTYIAVGALAYPLLTREFFEGSAGLAAQVMRTPAEPALWAHVTRWMLPFQVLRGVLIALVLYPFLGTITRWSYSTDSGTSMPIESGEESISSMQLTKLRAAPVRRAEVPPSAPADQMDQGAPLRS